MYKNKENVMEKELEVKRGHVLSELLETERIYVNELGSIIQVNYHLCSHVINFTV